MRYIGRIEDVQERIKWAKKVGLEGWSVNETMKHIEQFMAKTLESKEIKPIKKPENDYKFSLKDGFIHINVRLPDHYGYATILEEIGNKLHPWLESHPKENKV